MIQYWLFRLCAFAARRVPRTLGYRMASLVADLIYLVWREKRDITIENMTHVVGANGGPDAAKRLARESLRNYGKYLVDFVRFPGLKREEIVRSVTFNDWEHFDRALQHGKGMLFVGVHMGNWDLGAAFVAVRDYPLNVIAETFAHPKLNHHVQGTRSALGLRVIPMEQAARRILRVLRQNEMLAILIDRPSPDDGVPVRFFDSLANVPAGVATIALRTGARIVPGCLVRQKDNSYLAIAERHIEYDPVGDMTQDVQALTQQIMDRMESMVRQYPDQWYMFRPMWARCGGLRVEG
ncbi:MAG: lysophospholipid acyltransferase family protein [Chloroflexi bacterium]|nr:lysophospholipid acyltransferase family protein [Chloroflexota bacterium]